MNSIENLNAVTPISSPGDPLERPLVSRYSIIHQIVVYPFVAFIILLMFMALGEWDVFIMFTVCFMLLLIPVWFVSAVVRVDGSGINMSRLFGIYRREIEWMEIESIKPGHMGVGVKLRTAEGRSMAISSQMSQYPAIVEILRTLRPDLFTLPRNSAGAMTFQKSFFGKYWLLFLSSAMTIVFFASIPTIVPAIFFGFVIYMMWSAALYAVHTVSLDGNRLSTRSLRARQELTSQQIKDIRMVTHYSRRGVATRLIQVELLDGTDFAMTGFPEGNEIMYGILKNWWSSYQNG